MVVSKNFILEKHFDGLPKESDFKLVEEELPPLKEGEILCLAEWISVDPYMRALGSSLELGKPMVGSSVSKIIESKNETYKVGMYIVAYCGWRDSAIINPDTYLGAFDFPVVILPDFGNLPRSLGLGILGMPGNSAYFGFLEICKPKAGEVVAISGAAGAVGSHVGQIAKIKGCKVIGFAGSDDKVKWLKEELGFDAAYNYKSTDIDVALKESAPEGVDCYFDNVGGEMSSKIMNHMTTFGRISVCGCISNYNESKPADAPVVQLTVIFKQLKMEGFLVNRWNDRWNEGINQNLNWIKEGKLKFKETIEEGFEKLPEALIRVLTGKNTGKAIIKV